MGKFQHIRNPQSARRLTTNMTPTDVESSIPPSAKPLAPYLRSGQDALRIRQALTLYLQSHIVLDDDDADTTSTHLSLTVPINASVNVKRITSDVTGVRREYLKALQENVAVKREYNDLSDRITSRQLFNEQQSTRPSKPTGLPDASAETHSSVNDYLSLLRERRRYEKLQLFDLHLKELASTADPPDEQQQSNSTARTSLGGLPKGNEYETTDGSGKNVEALISKLEKTVVKAKAKLVKEQNLLRELQSRQASNDGDLDVNKLAALHRTRDELVQWVEEKLAITTTAENDTNHEQRYADDTNAEETSQIIAERKTQIREQYAAYVEARKSLLDAVSLLSQPTRSAAGSQPTKKPAQPDPSPNDLIQDTSAIDVFRAVSEQILPATKYQKSLALQRSYLAGMLTKEKTNLKHTLDRLSQESHLLPEYPILARQAKFKHITTTATGTGGQLNREEGEGKLKARDDVLEHAQAWAFAAEAARSSESDYIEQRIEHGVELADTASETLQQVYDLLHQERNPDVDDAAEGDTKDDIWTAEVQSRKPRARRQNEKKQQQVKGPWSALNGRVGE